MGNKIKNPSDCEREKKRTAQHPCYNIQPWLTFETFVLPSCICLTAILHRLWLWKYWKFAMDIEELYGHMQIYSLVIMLEYGWVPEVRDSYRFMSKAIVVPEFLISDTVPDSLMSNVGPRYLAYYYYSALCRKALLAIVYCTRSNKFFLLCWCNINWHFLASYNNFSF